MPLHNPKWGRVLTPEDRQKFALPILTLQHSDANGIVWNTLLARTSIRQENSGDTGPTMTLAAMPLGKIKPSGSANLVIGVNPQKYFKLKLQAQVEMLLITLSKVLNGRIGSRGIELERRFGRDAAELGMLIYLTQAKTIKTTALEEAGYKIPTCESFGLPTGQTWNFYAEAMYKLAEASKQQMMEMMGVDSIIDEEEASVDDAMRSLFSDLQQRTDLAGSQRGLFAGDVSEYLKTLYTTPQVKWEDVLRYKESGRGRQFTVPTRRRQSRRGPPSMYFGHRWAGRCNVVVICDTSGSRSISQIATITSELRAMVGRGARVVFAQADTIIQNVYEYTGMESDLEIFGRGGTEIQPAIDQLDVILDKVNMDELDVLIIATDGYTDAIDCGDYETLILLDNDTTKPENYRNQVSGSRVDIQLLELPDKLNDPNATITGN